MSEEIKSIIDLGRGSDSIARSNDPDDGIALHVNDIYSLEPTVSGALKESKPLYTIGEHFKTFGSNASTGMIPGVGLIAVALKVGIEKNEHLSNIFLHGNNTDRSMHRSDDRQKEMTDEERLEIKTALLEYSAKDLSDQSAAQVAVVNNPDFGPDDEYRNKGVGEYLSKDERENIALNDRERISTPSFKGM